MLVNFSIKKSEAVAMLVESDIWWNISDIL